MAELQIELNYMNQSEHFQKFNKEGPIVIWGEATQLGAVAVTVFESR